MAAETTSLVTRPHRGNNKMRYAYDLSPRPALVTGLVFILYLILWLSTTLIQAGPPKPPSHTDIQKLGFDLEIASQDLAAIASASHPYNSRQNEAVHTYILSRLQPLKEQFTFVDISVDQDGGAYWYGEGSLTYFESTNILFKIEGTRTDLKGVMFAAHYDSVSTSHGTTDNGIGVITLLQLASYFTTHRPKRTVLLNFNNGEEDGLLGSHAFLLHPWAQLVKPFINLEGSGSGGRPIVFRTSSQPLTKAFRPLSHSHGSALSSDAFSMGLIRSSTDFSVYNVFGMGGIDMAFYSRRNRYHSFDDTIESLDEQGSIGGGKNGSIWSMISNAWGAGLELTEDEDPNLGEISGGTVYFDIFGRGMAVFTTDSVFAGNVALLVIGPLALLTAYALLIRNSRYRVTVEWITEDHLRGWGRFLISFILCVGLTIGFSLVHSASNPFIIASHANVVVLCIFSLSICALCIPLYLFGFFRPLPSPAPLTRQTSQIFLSLYALWWILLLIYTILLRTKQIGGLYFFTFFNAFALLVALIDLGAGVLYVALAKPVEPEGNEDDKSSEGSPNPGSVDPAAPTPQTKKAEKDPNSSLHGVKRWIQSLRHRHTSTQTMEQEALETRYGLNPSSKATDRLGLWIAQLMISLSFPVLLVMQLCLLLVTALSGTLADGSSPTLVYLLLSVMVICTVLPLAPFAHRIHPLFHIALFIIFFSTVIYDNTAFPFSKQDKFKAFWSQTLDLATGESSVKLIGVERYLKEIPSHIPSASSQLNSALNLDDAGTGKVHGLKASFWDGPALAVVSNTASSSWMNASVTRTNATSARFLVRADQSKNCRFIFDKNIGSLDLASATPIPFHPYFPLSQGGTNTVALWTRTESRELNATVTWDPSITGNTEDFSLLNSGKDVPRKVRVSCYYADVTRGRIPALDEAVDHAPEWVAITGSRPLVEVYREFEL